MWQIIKSKHYTSKTANDVQLRIHDSNVAQSLWKQQHFKQKTNNAIEANVRHSLGIKLRTEGDWAYNIARKLAA